MTGQDAGAGRRLVIHIGSGKCGSSAIQSFLAANAALLRADGILIPGADLDLTSHQRGNQLRFFNHGIGEEGFAESVTTRLAKLSRQMDECGCHTMILSAENLINPRGFHSLFTASQDRYDIEIMAYVRRQDDLMVSAWQQWHLKSFPTFEAYARQTDGSLDWFARLEPWRAAHGTDALNVRVFSRQQLLDGDVVADFAHQAGLEIDRYQRVPDANRSLHERFNRVANTYRDVLFESAHDHGFYTFIEELLGERAYKDYRGSAMLTLDQRRDIYGRYGEANEQLRSLYFPDLSPDPGVFPAPTAADVADFDLNPGEKDDVHDLAYVAMYTMFKRLRRLERQVASTNG